MKEKRIPRPAGLTYLLTTFHNIGNEGERKEITKKVLNRIVQEWYDGGGYMNGRKYTTLEIASLVGMNEVKLLQFISNKQQQKWRLLYGEDYSKGLQNAHEASLFEALNGAWAAISQINSQADILIRSQGSSYKPFITPEVTKALELKLKGAQHLLSLSMALAPKNRGAQDPLNEGSSGIPTGTQLTRTQAMELLATDATVLDNEGSQTLLLQEYGASDIFGQINGRSGAYGHEDHKRKTKPAPEPSRHEVRSEIAGEIEP
jgi:hypothetical protein